MIENDVIFEMKHVCVDVKDFSLKNINLKLHKGYITGLVGLNGAGKTTLIKAMQNTYIIKSGTIQANGYDHMYQKRQFANEVGYVMEEMACPLSNLSIWKNIELIRPLYDSFDEELLIRYLVQYGIVTGEEKDYQKQSAKNISYFSTGQRVRILIAFALAHHPSVLILDEPTGNLDPIFRREFLDDLQELISEEEVSVLLCTHLTEDLDRLADYLIVMDEGEVIDTGKKEDLYKKYDVAEVKQVILKASELHKNDTNENRSAVDFGVKKKNEFEMEFEHSYRTLAPDQTKKQKREGQRYLKQRENQLKQEGVSTFECYEKLLSSILYVKKLHPYQIVGRMACLAWIALVFPRILTQSGGSIVTKDGAVSLSIFAVITVMLAQMLYIHLFQSRYFNIGVFQYSYMIPYIPVDRREYNHYCTRRYCQTLVVCVLFIACWLSVFVYAGAHVSMLNGDLVMHYNDAVIKSPEDVGWNVGAIMVILYDVFNTKKYKI